MRRHVRWAALLVCVGMLLMLFVSSAYIAHEAGHDCVGEGCPVCAFIARLREAQRGFSLALASSAALLILSSRRAVSSAKEACLPAGDTLVRRKIRLNN